MTCIGLISDTHLPDRWDELPPSVFDVLDGVNLILHAGDVGTLQVLDDLSAIAPVVAVHGNDELDPPTVEALPYFQLIPVSGQRIYLSHAHYPDRAAELASRQIDDWQRILQRRVELGRAHGADIVVFGHTHIPMAVEMNGMWLINPGAIASGTHLLRQTLQSVARLWPDERRVAFFDLNAPAQPFQPPVDLSAGFEAAHVQTSEPLVDEALFAPLYDCLKSLTQPEREQVLDILRPQLLPCWKGQQAQLDVAAALQAIIADPHIPNSVRQAIESRPALAAYL